MISAETLLRHELAGLAVRVVDADDPGRVGTAGRVATETEQTLGIDVSRSVGGGADGDAVGGDDPSGDGPETGRSDQHGGTDADDDLVTVPKRGTTFEFVVAETDPAEPPVVPAPTAPGSGRGRPADASDGADGDDSAIRVRIEGDRLVAPPARRTEQTGDSRWR